VTQEEIMQQIIQLVQEGAEGTPLSTEAETALRTRYFDWIDKKKDGVPSRPIEIWEQKEGKDIQKQIRKIGQAAARLAKDKNKKEVDGGDAMMASAEMESISPCPHCPVAPDPEP
jgi:hypothetical protein